MPANVTCSKCGNTRTLSKDDITHGRWRHKHCPVCTPPERDDDRLIDDEYETGDAA